MSKKIMFNDKFGYNPSNIGNCCNGKKKTAYGYVWKYAE